MKDRKIKLNSHTILLLITVALFIALYLLGCILYSKKGFTHLQTFKNLIMVEKF